MWYTLYLLVMPCISKYNKTKTEGKKVDQRKQERIIFAMGITAIENSGHVWMLLLYYRNICGVWLVSAAK